MLEKIETRTGWKENILKLKFSIEAMFHISNQKNKD